MQFLDGGEAVFLDRLGHVRVQRLRLTGRTEGAVIGIAPCPARDLRQLVGHQMSETPAVELGRTGKSHVVDVEVQPHPDGISRHQMIHIAVLVQFHLRVARPGAERAHHHRRATLLPAQQFRHRIDAIDREPHDGGACGHAAGLLAAGICQFRQPLTPDESRLGDQVRDPPAHRVRTQKQRLMQSTRVQQPVGKDVAPVGVGA